MQAFSHVPFQDRLSLALPAGLSLLLAGVIALQTGLLPLHRQPQPALPRPALVTISPGSFLHRLDGEYYRNGYAVDAPKQEIAFTEPLDIMKFPVTADEYDACVAEGACAPREPGHAPDAPNGEQVPATGVSHDDALAYAAWLSRGTGAAFDLPSDTEWAYAAGSSFVDDALGIDPDSRNPALRWLADYNRETARKASSDPAPKPLGRYGVNEHGVADLAGNVWEWTSSCQRRVDLAAATKRSEERVCGIYTVEGKHRAALSAFVRDARSGGCSVGAPPDNLGFRLVRRPGLFERAKYILGL